MTNLDLIFWGIVAAVILCGVLLIVDAFVKHPVLDGAAEIASKAFSVLVGGGIVAWVARRVSADGEPPSDESEDTSTPPDSDLDDPVEGRYDHDADLRDIERRREHATDDDPVDPDDDAGDRWRDL